MGARDDDIRVRIAGDLADINRSLSDLRKGTRQAGREARNSQRDWNQLGQGLSGLKRQITGVVAAYLSFRGITSLFRSVIAATVRQEEVTAQLEARLRSTGHAAGFTADELLGIASSLQQVTRFGDESIISAQSVLLTYTQIGRETFPRALDAVLDFATAMNVDVTNAAETVGRALGEPLRAANALQRQGFTFSTGQMALIRSLVETGRVAEAQAIILDELELAYEGSARAARDTLGGALESLRNTVGDLLEGSGGNVTGLRNEIERLNELLQDPAFQQGFQSFVQGLATIARVSLEAVGELGNLGQQIGFTIANIAGNVEELDRLEAEIQAVDRALNNSFMGRPIRFLLNSREELERMRAELEGMRDALLEQSGLRPGGPAAAAPAAERTAAPTEMDVRPQLQRFQAQLAASRRLLEDELKRLRAELDREFEQNLVTFEEYYRRRAEMETQQVDQQLQQQRAALRLLEEEIRLGRQRDDDVREQQNRRLDLVAQITVLERQRADAALSATRAQADAEQRLARELEDVAVRLARMQGDVVGARTAELEREFSGLMQRLQIEGDAEGQALVERLVNVELARTRLEQLEAEYQRTMAALLRAEQRVQIQVDTGTISQAEGRRQIIRLNQEYAGQLEDLIPLMREMAEATGDPAAIERLRDMEVELHRLQVTGEQVAAGLRQAFDDAGETFLERFATNARTVGGHLNALFGDIQRQLVRLAANQVWQQLFSGMSGQASGFLANLFHSGGVVGAGGPARRVPAIAFAGAPRLHTGGIPGLRSGEIPAILERGEEVLTRSDPRHRFNGGGKIEVNVAAETVRGVQQSQMQIGAAVGDAIRFATERNR